MPFCIGVPLKDQRNVVFKLQTPFAVWVMRFLMTWDSSRMIRYHFVSRKRVDGLGISRSSACSYLSHAFHSYDYCELIWILGGYNSIICCEDDVVFEEFCRGFG